MEKNPISYLQEYMMQKHRVTPVYEVVKSTTGTHINTFHIKVTCHNHSAEGIGSSKKEARTNAALKLIDELKINSNSPKIVQQSIISSRTVLEKSGTEAINYVGKLQEFAASRHGVLPEYIDKNVTGASHNPTFTVVCKYQGLEEEAKGGNKKLAKTLAAKQMFERVSSEMKIILPKSEIKSYLQTMSSGMEDLKIHEDIQTAKQKSADRALENYERLSKISMIETCTPKENRPFNEYHTFLKDSFSYRKRDLVVDKLRDTLNACKSCIKFGDQISSPMAMLKAALKILNINIKEEPNNMGQKCIICCLQLDTNPTISEIGYGKSKKEAEILAIFSMVETLIVMLKG